MSGPSRLLLLDRAVEAAPELAVPLTLDDLWGWYDASDDDSFTYGDPTRVSQWNDLSGNGHHLVQANADHRPERVATIGGLTAVSFNPLGNQRVTATVSDVNTDYTSLIVVHGQAMLSERIFMSFRSSTDDTPIIAQFGSGNGDNKINADHRDNGGGLSRIGAMVWNNDTTKLVVVTKHGAALRVYDGGGTAIANTVSASTGATTVDTLCLGGTFALSFGSAFEGDIGEVIHCNSYIGFDGINEAGEYLADKWSQSWTTITA